MAVQISSLRVTASLDSSAFTAGATAIAAAQEKLAASGKLAGAALAQIDAAAEKAVPGLARLSTALITGYGEGAKFAAGLKSIERQLNVGNIGTDKAAILYQGLVGKFGQIAGSAQAASLKLAGLGPVIENVNVRLDAQATIAQRTAAAIQQLNNAQQAQVAINARLGVGAEPATKFGASFEALAAREEQIAQQRGKQIGEEFGRSINEGFRIGLSATDFGATFSALADREEMIARGRAERTAQSMQQTIATNTGLGATPATQLGATTSALSAQADEVMRLERAYSVLVNTLDTESAALNRLTEQIAMYDRMAELGIGNTQLLAAATEKAKQNFGIIQKNMSGAAGAARMTNFELANLGFQFNDIGVMMASGQNPFTLIMQQGMQIAQIMIMSSVASKGLMASLRGLGTGLVTFLTNPINVAVLALAGLALGSVALFKAWQGNIPSLKEALDKHAEIIGRIKDLYGEAAASAAKFNVASKDALTADIRGQTTDLQKLLQDQASRLSTLVEPKRYGGLLGGGQMFMSGGVAPRFSEFTDAIETFRKGLEAGNADFRAFDESVARRQNLDALNTNLQTAGRELRKFAADGLEAQKSLQGLTPEFARLQRATTFSKTLGGYPGVGDLRSYLPDIRTEIEKIDESYQKVIQNAQTTSQVVAATKDWREAIAAVNREYEAAAKNFTLSIQALNAKSPAQLAEVAAQRALIQANIDGRVTEQEWLEVSRAGALARAQAEHDLAEAARQRAQSARDANESASNDLAVIGMGIEQTQLLNLNWQTYADLRKQAEDTNTQIDMAELARLQAINAEIAKKAQLTAIAQMNSDLIFERSQLGRSSNEQAVASQMRSVYGDDYLNYMDSVSAAYMRQTQLLTDMKSAASDVLHGMLSDLRSGLTFWEAWANAITNITDKLLNKALDTAIDRLFSVLSGAPSAATPGAGGIGGIISGIFSRGTTTSSAPLPVTLATPTGATGSSAILNLIGQAEGTDRGRGYNETLGYGAFTGGNQNLTGMTLDQVNALQTSMLQNPANSFNSSALGRYQITQTTMQGLRTQMGFTGDELYDPAMQDLMAQQLLENRGTNLSGLRQEWAGLGNVSDTTIQDALAQSGQTISTSATQFSGDFSGTLGGLATQMSQSSGAFSGNFSGALNALVNSIGGTGLSSQALGAISTAGSGLFAAGGYTGHGGRFEPAGTVHRGEFVVNAGATRRYRSVLESINRRGYADGGYVNGAAPSIRIINNGTPQEVTSARQTNGPAPSLDIVTRDVERKLNEKFVLTPRRRKMGVPNT